MVSATGPYVHVVWMGYFGLLPQGFYKRSTDRGASWSQDVVLTGNLGYVGGPSISAADTNVNLVWGDSRSGVDEIYYKSSTDGGGTWSGDIRLTYSDPSSDRGFPSVSAADSAVHVVWEDSRNRSSQFNMAVYYKSSTDQGATWSQDTILSNNPDTVAVYLLPSVSASGSNVHVAWGDDGRSGNDEIYYKLSTDGGKTWSQDVRLTYAPDSSLHPSFALTDTMVHVVWEDRRDGNWEIYYKRNLTGNRQPSGVETSVGRLTDLRTELFKATPNPFASFTKVAGHEGKRFVLYDLSGRHIGVYQGDRIGEGLGPGVYFLKYQEMLKQPMNQVQGMVQHDEIVRIVKVR